MGEEASEWHKGATRWDSGQGMLLFSQGLKKKKTTTKNKQTKKSQRKKMHRCNLAHNLKRLIGILLHFKSTHCHTWAMSNQGSMSCLGLNLRCFTFNALAELSQRLGCIGVEQREERQAGEPDRHGLQASGKVVGGTGAPCE